MGKEWDWPAVGIDLGTRFTRVAIWEHGRVEIIVNDQGNRKTPSCVAFTEKQCLIGDAAANQRAQNPANTIFEVKNLIGRKLSDAAVQKLDFERCPFKIVYSFLGEKKLYTAEEICSMVLMNMKETAEAYLCKEVKNAVITVPAYFSDSERRATKNVGLMAGFNNVRIISEPIAATVAYGIHKEASRNVLVFDHHCRALDVSVLTINSGTVEFKSVSGHSKLGGDVFDKRLASSFIEKSKQIYGHRKYFDADYTSPLAACEKAKRNLSTCSETVCQKDGFYFTITRAKFENMFEDVFKECMMQVEKCLRNAKMERNEIDYVVLIGGSTRIPKVQQMLQEFFKGKKVYNTLNAEEVIAYGAAMHAAMLAGVHVPRFTLTELHRVEDGYSPPLMVHDIDSLLENLSDGMQGIRINPTTISKSKGRLMKLLEEIRLKPDDLQLTQQVSQLLKSFYPYLPNHLLTIVKSLEEDLFASQHQFIEWASKEGAIPVKLEDVESIQTQLVRIKTNILKKSSSRNQLRSEISAVEKAIANLVDRKAKLEADLGCAEQDLQWLTRSMEPQIDLARQQTDQLAKLQEVINLKANARTSVEATLNRIADNFKNL